MSSPLLALILLAIILLVVSRSRSQRLAAIRSRATRLVWRLRPRTPKDCPLCQQGVPLNREFANRSL